MNSKNHSLILSIAFACVCAIAVGCSFIPFIISSSVSRYFSSETFGYLGQMFACSGGKTFLAGGIAIYVGIAYVLAMTLIALVKKRSVYMLFDLLSAVLGVFVALLAANYLGYRPADPGILGVGIVLALLAIVSALLPLLFCEQKKEEPKLVPLPSTIPSVEKHGEEKQEEETPAEPAEEEKKTEEKEEPKVENKEESNEDLSKEKKEEDKPIMEKKKAAPKEERPVAKAKVNKAQGKYEVYPEAGFFKYRLKANNGEILIVSNGYKTRDGAKKGIETLKKNVASGLPRIIIDKKGYGQFRIFTANDSRLIVSGEFYPNAAGAQSALDSVEKFYVTDKIVDLDEIPESEIREWRIALANQEGSDKGKFEIYIDEANKFRGRLLANNGQLLFATSAYSSKSGVSGALEKVQKKFSSKDVTITCDKQGRYQFVVYADNGSVLVMGESYPTKDRALSAAQSSKNFSYKPTIVDVTKEEE